MLLLTSPRGRPHRQETWVPCAYLNPGSVHALSISSAGLLSLPTSPRFRYTHNSDVLPILLPWIAFHTLQVHVLIVAFGGTVFRSVVEDTVYHFILILKRLLSIPKSGPIKPSVVTAQVHTGH